MAENRTTRYLESVPKWGAYEFVQQVQGEQFQALGKSQILPNITSANMVIKDQSKMTGQVCTVNGVSKQNPSRLKVDCYGHPIKFNPEDSAQAVQDFMRDLTRQ